ncbi:MAG: hypothetical protein J6A69_12730 [Clostridia bacterium]|nr:hypothetical protein [Clostridia bacterium]
MFEKLFTTKMSPDKKTIENRFEKIWFKNSGLFRFLSALIFVLLIILIIFTVLYMAVNSISSKEYMYNSQQLFDYEQSSPDSGNGEIIYADKERFIYTHMGGLFVYSFKEGVLEYAYNMEKITGQSGDFDVVASEDGNKIWVRKFDKETEYEVNLKNGRVRETAYDRLKAVFVPEEDYIFHNDSLSWSAVNSFMNDGVKYQLWAVGETNLSLTVEKVYTSSKTYGSEMIFGEKYKSKDDLKKEKSAGMVPYEMKAVEGSNLVFKVNRKEIIQIDSIVTQSEEKFVSAISEFDEDSYDVYIKRISGDNEIFASMIVFVTMGEEVREIAYGYMYRDEYEKTVDLLGGE